MNLIKRAGLSLWSRKGKTLIMLGTFLVISAMVLGGVLIRDATAQAGEATKRELGAEVSLGMDFDSLSSGGSPGTAPQISADAVDKIGTSPLVEKYNYKSFNGARLLDGAETTSDKPLTPGMDADFTLAHGVLDSSLLPDFSSGKWELLSGEPITAADTSRNVILIEERLAKKNRLKVGGRITLGENDPKGKRRADFTVKGIYRDPSDEPDPEYQQFPGDRLIVPATALAALNSGGEKEPAQLGGATFRLKDPETFDAFKTEAKKTAGSALDGFKLGINDKAVQQMTGPLRSITSSANAAMWLIGVAGAIVLGLLTALAVKQRRKEFGVLLAMGEKKWKLIAQQAVETVVVATLAIALSAAFAGSLTQKASDALLSSEAAAAQRKIDSWQPPPPGSTGLNEGIDHDDEPTKDADPIDKITVRLDPMALGTVAGVGLGIGLLATAIPAASVLRLNPRTILTKGK
ncbi:ABC transporter permease [Streptomyces olivoreticuli]|uniref:ABC transporter permease n=1 Tax=Streptomyces olivoreticuli TaxID=68246 RepID=UPI000E241303|nr:ABC transporter permease [Streptomyces olivoreticuli]